MNDETKVEVDLKKPEVTNNEQMVDVKPGVATVVIPSKPVEPKKEEPAAPAIDLSEANEKLKDILSSKDSK